MPLRTAIDPHEIEHLRREFGDFPVVPITLDVDSPFLDGTHQRILQDARRAEICYLLHRGAADAGLLFHRKRFYPEDAYRLPTGGIHNGEGVFETLVREVHEETSFTVDTGPNRTTPGAEENVVRVERLLGVLAYELRHRSLDRSFEFATYHFLTAAWPGAEPECLDPEEELAGWRWLDAEEMKRSANRLEGITQGTPWSHWGRFRALSHRHASQWLTSHLPECSAGA